MSQHMDWLTEIDDRTNSEPVESQPNRRPPLQCFCGRFAKWVGHQPYDVIYDCHRYTVHCSRHGDVDIECD